MKAVCFPACCPAMHEKRRKENICLRKFVEKDESWYNSGRRMTVYFLTDSVRDRSVLIGVNPESCGEGKMVSTEVLYHRVAWLSGAAFAAVHLGSWCFGTGKKFYYSTSPREKELGSILRVSGCLDEMYRDEIRSDRPVYLSDSVNLMWIGERLELDGKDHILVFLLGPFYLSSVSLQEVHNQLGRLDVALSARKQMMDILSNLPILSNSMANQYAVMLHYCLTEEYISPHEIQHGPYPDAGKEQTGSLIHQDMEEKLDLDARDTLPDSDDSVAYDRMVRSETMILNAVREGNSNILQVMDDEGYRGRLLFHTGDPLRDGKDTMIVFCAMCSRAAIEGGLQIRTAKRIEETYFNHAEQCRTQEELMHLNAQMIHEWVSMVRESRQAPDVSPAVQKGCDYIKANLLRPISAQSVAKEIGYTEYYFTRKFYAEKGIRLADYINRCRVEYAKIQLVTTSKTIQEISDDLHFGTRNYFSKIFHDIVGVTPKQYKERAGKITEN